MAMGAALAGTTAIAIVWLLVTDPVGSSTICESHHRAERVGLPVSNLSANVGHVIPRRAGRSRTGSARTKITIE
jgi:hypothetical protein